MVRALCTFLVFSLACGIARGEPAPTNDRNAALKYWQAIATLPKLSDAEFREFYSECTTMPLDDRAKNLVVTGAYSLRMLRHGTALSKCDWENDYEEGIAHILPHSHAGRTLAGLALLRARFRFEEGNNAGAVEDLFDALMLGRHISPEGSFISSLVTFSIEHKALDVLAANLPKLDKAEIQEVGKRYEALPPFASLSSVMMNAEIKCLDWLADQAKARKDKESLVAFLKGYFGPIDNARALLEKSGGDSEGMIRQVNAARPYYEKFAATFDLPVEEAKSAFDKLFAEAETNPVIEMFLPNMASVRGAQARIDVRSAMLRAAIAIQLEGVDALKNHPDPVVGSPFEFTKFEGGFELRSKYSNNPAPISLVVGHRK